MGHGAAGGNAEKLVGNGAGRTGAAADIGSPGAGDGGVRALCPAGTEFQHHTPLCRPNNAVGLGGHKALVVEDQQQEGLHQLCLNSRSPDSDDRLPGEDGSTLWDGPDVTREFEIAEIVQEPLGKQILAPEIFNVLLRKMQILNIGDDPLQTCADGVTAMVRNIAEKDIEIGDPILQPRFQITISHGQFVKVAEHRHIELICDIHRVSPSRYTTSYHTL